MKITNKTILWLDDDLSTPALGAEKYILLERGFRIIPVENPDDFFAALMKRDYDCIILDISLPVGLSVDIADALGGMRAGMVLLRRLMEARESLSVPIVVYTMSDTQSVRSYCMNHNILYINKFDAYPWTLADQLEQLLSKSEDSSL